MNTGCSVGRPAGDTAGRRGPLAVRVPIRNSDGPLFEYACHEGNYAMFNTLAGARAAEEEKQNR